MTKWEVVVIKKNENGEQRRIAKVSTSYKEALKTYNKLNKNNIYNNYLVLLNAIN